MPVYSKEIIANMAVGLLGVTARIDDFDNENTIPAINARLYFEHIRDVILEACPWPFALKREVLSEATVSETIIDYWPDWDFIYVYPVDCKLAIGIVNPADPSGKLGLPPIPFKIVDLPEGYGKAILCNQESAVLEYNQAVTDVNKFNASFIQAFTLGLAAHLAAPLRVAADIMKAAQDNFAGWLANAVNFKQREQRDDPMPDSELVRVRG